MLVLEDLELGVGWGLGMEPHDVVQFRIHNEAL